MSDEGRHDAFASLPVHPMLRGKEESAHGTQGAHSRKTEGGKERLNPYLGNGTGSVRRRALAFKEPGAVQREADALRAASEARALAREVAAETEALDLGADLVGDLLESPADDQVPWWDAAIVEAAVNGTLSSLVDSRVQRPALVRTHVADEHVPTVHLTPSERRKLRRMRRLERARERQEMVRLGLAEAPVPRIRVGAVASVLDPSRVEQVCKENAALRRAAHDAANRERSEDARRQRSEKRSSAYAGTDSPSANSIPDHSARSDGVAPKRDQRAPNAAKVRAQETHRLVVAVYTEGALGVPQRFRVTKNAVQHGLSGVVVFRAGDSALGMPSAVAALDGPATALGRYQRLVERRVDWGDPEARTRVLWTGPLVAEGAQGRGAGSTMHAAPRRLETVDASHEADGREVFARRNLSDLWRLSLSFL